MQKQAALAHFLKFLLLGDDSNQKQQQNIQDDQGIDQGTRMPK